MYKVNKHYSSGVISVDSNNAFISIGFNSEKAELFEGSFF